MSTLQYSLALSTAAFTGPMRAAQSAMRGFTASAGNIGSAITGMASLPGLVKSLVEPLTNPITLSADLEELETSFKSLLKSAPSAKTMVKDLMAFADATPFDPVPVAEAGKQLLAFAYAAKEVKPLLGDIGDLSAAMNKPLGDVANVFGRLKAADFGEAFERLRDFGISKLDLVGEGLQFDKGGSFLGSADQAITSVRKIIRQKFGGGMADLATTFRGLFSTFSGYWDGLQRSFGKPIMQALKPLLQDGTGELQKWTPLAEQWGRAIGSGLLVIRDLFQSGQLWETAKLGLQIAGATFVNTINAGLQGAIAGILSGLAESAGIFQRLMGESGLWQGIGYKMQSVFLGLKGTLLETFASVIESLPKILGGGASAATRGMRLDASIAGGQSTMASLRGDQALASIDMEGMIAQIAEGMRNTGSAALNGFQSAGQLIPTSGMIEQLTASLAPFAKNAEAFFAKQNGQAEAATASKETASNTRALIQIGQETIMSLRLISDKVGSQDAVGNFA